MTKVYRVIHTLFSGIIKLVFRIKVVGDENEPQSGSLLVCSNHIAATDPIIICASMYRQVCYMAKKELFKIPVFAQLIKGLGAFPIDRGGKDVSAVKKAIKLLEEDKCVGIFPQGTRQPGKNPRNTALKKGAAMIALRAEADVLPVYISRKNNMPKLFGKTTVVIGKPIKFSDFNYKPEESGEYERIVELIFDEVCKLGEGLEQCKM